MRIYGLIGEILEHSFSSTYFMEKFARENIDATFQNFELPKVDDFRQVIRNNPNIHGLSVTIPYKTSIIPFLDDIDAVASQIGSVNSILVRDGYCKGYNTDVFGFKSSIKPFLEHGMERALILGTGGASKAVAYSLQQIGLDVMFVSRKPSKSQLSYTDINQNVIKSFRLIVNTTPLGMYPNVASYPDLPYQYLSSSHLLYDLTYNPALTEFLRRGKERGATVINGLSMLHIQAEASWEIWNSRSE